MLVRASTAIALLCLTFGASACAEGGAFGLQAADDRVYVMSASTPVFLRSWNDNKYNGEWVLVADTLVLRDDGTGVMRTYIERRRISDTTQFNSTVTFRYLRSSDKLSLRRIRSDCGSGCTLPLTPPTTTYFDFVDGVLNIPFESGLVPYRRIE
jgi:hypothetical protein